MIDAQIANLKLQLSRTEVIAPVGGEVVERNAMVGAVATAAGDPMFAIIRDGELELRADVAERFMLKLKPGQKVTMTGVGQTEPLTGEVRLVEPNIDLASRLGQARITIDDDAAVRSGMFLSADILVAERDAVAVPVTAVGANADGADGDEGGGRDRAAGCRSRPASATGAMSRSCRAWRRATLW